MDSKLVCCGLILCWSSLAFAAQPATKPAGSKSGLERRVSWAASRIVGSPEPPRPYKVEPAFPRLKFARPLIITSAPGTERLFVAEQAGKIYSFKNDAKTDQRDLVVDLKQARPKLTAIYGLTFHPQFARNRFVYVCYVTGRAEPNGTRVVRFEMSRTDPPKLLVDSELPILDWLSGGHNGGCLKFGPDGYLYVASGDAERPTPPDVLGTGQDISDLLSSILRIDVDRTAAGKAYRVPDDNPFLETEGARPEVWAYGFRNPWKMSFDRQTGDLWVGDVGWELWEMIYRVQKGGNYGWSIMEGRQSVRPGGKRGPTPILPPMIDHPHSEAGSITGGFVYRGKRLAQLAGAYIYGDYQSGIVWGARVEGDKVVWHEELARTPLQLVGFGEDHAGELFLLDHREQIYRLVENPEQDTSQSFPRKLSETGLFQSVIKETPTPGVLPYSINAQHWADGTGSRRWLAVPGTETITVNPKGTWLFPDGSVLAKTVSIEFERGNAESKRRLETQILHREAGSWRPYTYAWNDAQTDATLVDASGFSRTLEIRDADAPEGLREQTHRFAARSECMFCHNPWVEAKTTIFGRQSASPLGVSVAQLSRDHAFADATANQVRTYQHIGLLGSKLPQPLAETPTFANPYDESEDLNARARAYLHVNCSHCHQFNAGGAATIILSHDVKLEDAQLLNALPTQGTFGITDARIVSPGDPLGSLLLYRIAKLGGGRMPRAGTREVDQRGVSMIHDWIAQLPADPTTPNSNGAPTDSNTKTLETLRAATVPEARAEAITRLTSSTRGALALLRAVDEGRLTKSVRTEVVALTKDHAQAEVRDLFERFVPISQRIKRLGTVVNQAEILSLEANVARGRQVFFGDAAGSCKNCHRVKDVGETLGPDLTQIGKKYARDQLLQHVLEPSKFIEPKYVSYLLETVEGRVLAGLLEGKTDDEVVLRDAQNKLHRVKSDDVELLAPQRNSLMPELLLRDMTRQQVADLLAYLEGLK